MDLSVVTILEIAGGFFVGYIVAKRRASSHERRCTALNYDQRCVYSRFHSGPHKLAWYKLAMVDYWENEEEKAVEREIGLR